MKRSTAPLLAGSLLLALLVVSTATASIPQQVILRAQRKLHMATEALFKGAHGQFLRAQEAEPARMRRALAKDKTKACRWNLDHSICTEDPMLAEDLFARSSETTVVPMLKCVYAQTSGECVADPYCRWDDSPLDGAPHCSFKESHWTGLFAKCLPNQSVFHEIYACLMNSADEDAEPSELNNPACATPCMMEFDGLCMYNPDMDPTAATWAGNDPMIVAELDCWDVDEESCKDGSREDCEWYDAEFSWDGYGQCEVTLEKALDVLVEELDDKNDESGSGFCSSYFKPMIECMVATDHKKCTKEGHSRCQWGTPDAFQFAVNQFDLALAYLMDDEEEQQMTASAWNDAEEMQAYENSVSSMLNRVHCYMKVEHMLDYFFSGDKHLRDEAVPLEHCYAQKSETECLNYEVNVDYSDVGYVAETDPVASQGNPGTEWDDAPADTEFGPTYSQAATPWETSSQGSTSSPHYEAATSGGSDSSKSKKKSSHAWIWVPLTLGAAAGVFAMWTMRRRAAAARRSANVWATGTYTDFDAPSGPPPLGNHGYQPPSMPVDEFTNHTNPVADDIPAPVAELPAAAPAPTGGAQARSGADLFFDE